MGGVGAVEAVEEPFLLSRRQALRGVLLPEDDMPPVPAQGEADVPRGVLHGVVRHDGDDLLQGVGVHPPDDVRLDVHGKAQALLLRHQGEGLHAVRRQRRYVRVGEEKPRPALVHPGQGDELLRQPRQPSHLAVDGLGPLALPGGELDDLGA